MGRCTDWSERVPLWGRSAQWSAAASGPLYQKNVYSFLGRRGRPCHLPQKASAVLPGLRARPPVQAYRQRSLQGNPSTAQALVESKRVCGLGTKEPVTGKPGSGKEASKGTITTLDSRTRRSGHAESHEAGGATGLAPVSRGGRRLPMSRISVLGNFQLQATSWDVGPPRFGGLFSWHT